MIILTIIILLINEKGRKKYTFFFALARKYLLNFQDFFGGEGVKILNIAIYILGLYTG